MIARERDILKIVGSQGHCQFLVEVQSLGILELSAIDPVYYYIDMELCSWDLERFMLGSNELRGDCSIWKIMLNIARGVEFVHSRDIIIRDLKPSRGTWAYCRRR